MPPSRQRRFPRAHGSARAARTFTSEVLTEWGVTERLEDIQLCVSELATNALLHGVPPGREFSLELVADGPPIRVKVRDSGGGHPRWERGELEGCGGRGLYLAQALSDDFGVTWHTPGKTVWLTFKTASPPPAAADGE
ncbi:ATP-binding protein [Streptomyces sp. NPDC087300]|uniref:ATP-binding protein n=1 Tax=Streptomyces sp. NPDC087300 TaxID=3365780 RepID=UPI00381CEB5B